MNKLGSILHRALMRSVRIVGPVVKVQQCRNCRWMEGDYGWRPSEEYHDGTCHRHAPIQVKDDRMGTPNVALWPHVKGRDRCGDFEQYDTPHAQGSA